MDHRDRDKFYSPPSKPNDDDDDDGDYELEPPDPEILANEVKRAKDAIDATNATIDIDEIYRDASQQRSDEILQNWFRGLRGFRFQVKHLLIATAVLAIILTVGAKMGWGGGFALLVMLSIGGLFFYFQWQEQKAEEEATRRRQEMYARRRAHFEKMSGKSAPEDTSIYTAGPEPASGQSSDDTGDAWDKATAREPFSFQFSLAQMMLAMTTAAVIFGLVHLSGASNAATMLGFVALIGLVVHALGVQPPSIVVLGWWLILVLYVMLSIAAALWSGLT
jgi:hypothetical protein